MNVLPHHVLGVGPALVLLHAFPLDRSLWDAIAPSLAAEGWQVIVPDLPGFGVDDEPAATVDAMADRVADLLRHLGVHSAVIGGCSLGGYVALAFAAQFPEQTAGLMLIDTKASADDDLAQANRAGIAEQLERSGSMAALAATQAEALLSAATRAQCPEVETWLRATVLAQRPASAAAAQRAMSLRPARFDALRALRVPVLCIRGADDRIASAADQAAMAQACGDALDITVPDAGHLLPVEQPEALVAHAAAFLGQVRGPSC